MKGNVMILYIFCFIHVYCYTLEQRNAAVDHLDTQLMSFGGSIIYVITYVFIYPLDLTSWITVCWTAIRTNCLPFLDCQFAIFKCRLWVDWQYTRLIYKQVLYSKIVLKNVSSFGKQNYSIFIPFLKLDI